MRADRRRPSVENLRRAVHAFSASERRLRGRSQRAGDSLSPGHLRALFLLMAENRATAGRIAREAELNPASVTALIDQLEARGLVARRRDDADRRVSWISLTEAGRDEVAEKEAQWNQRLTDAFADTSDTDLETATRVIERLAAVFDTAGIQTSDVPRVPTP